jgi:hypothetical protein
VSSRIAGAAPEGWGGLLSVPSALSSLRVALTPELDGMKLVRAVIVVAGLAALAFLAARAEIGRVDAGDGAS